MTVPLWETKRQLYRDDIQAVCFSVHKCNPYITDREITLEEAIRCVVYQSRWAASHQVNANGHPIHNTSPEMQDELSIEIENITDIPKTGRFVTFYVSEAGGARCCSQLMVSESRSHFFFVDTSMAAAKAKTIEL